MKTPVLFTIVLTIHGLAIGSFLLIGGCTTRSGLSARSTSGATAARAADDSATARRTTDRRSATGGATAVDASPAVRTETTRVRSMATESPRADQGRSTVYTSTNSGRRPMPPSRAGASAAKYTPPSIASVGGPASTPSVAGVSSKSWTPPATSTTKQASAPASMPGRSAVRSTEGSTVYVIKKGDVLSRVAYKHGVSTKELAEYNNLATPDAIRVDQKILIPPHATKKGSGAATVTAASAGGSKKASGSTTKVPAGATKYTVKGGDSLSVIAYRHGTTVSSIRAANQLSGDRINVGDVLIIEGATKKPKTTVASVPASKPSKPKSSGVPTVKVPSLNPPAGAADTGFTKIESISDAKPASTKPRSIINSDLGVSAAAAGAALEAPTVTAPAVSVPSATAPKVEIPAVTATETKPLEQAFEYVVQDGETVDGIARAFIVSAEDVRKLNGLGNNDKIKPGQTLKIPPSIF